EDSAHIATICPTEETPSQTEREKDDMITKELVSKTADVKKEFEQEPQDTKPIPITIVKPTDEPRDNILKKKNKVVEDLMNSLSKKYKRLIATPDKLQIKLILSAPRQVLSLTSGRKRKAQELEPKFRIPRLECNRSLPKGVQCVNNQVTEHPKNEIFFIDVFGDEAFHKMSDIHKVVVDTLLGYLVMALNINTPANQRFYALLRSLIESHPDKENLNSKKVKLEAIGYSMN
nr:hypothetical protein [Tanacetum cinerariifolium]